MKVLLIDPSLYTPPYDGALAEALGRRGHEVLLAGRPTRPTDPPFGGAVQLRPIFYRQGERARHCGRAAQVLKGFEHAAGLAALQRLVAAERPDVVHWQWPSLPWLDAGALRALSALAPQVVTVHDGRVFKTKRGLRRLQSAGWGRFVRGADAVIAHVASTRATLAGFGVPAERVTVVPHPIFARPGAEAAASDPTVTPSVAAAGVGGTPTRPASARLCVLFFGRLSRDKGIDVLARALERLPEAAHARLHVVVCGPPLREDPGVAEAVSRLRRLRSVDLCLGFVPEPALDRRLARADVVVLPHREVDASGVLMKALGYDVALVASDVPAFREVLGDAPVAEYFTPGDPDALARALARLALDPARTRAMGQAAAVLRTGALSWSRAAEATEAVYRDCVRREQPALAARRA